MEAHLVFAASTSIAFYSLMNARCDIPTAKRTSLFQWKFERIRLITRVRKKANTRCDIPTLVSFILLFNESKTRSILFLTRVRKSERRRSKEIRARINTLIRSIRSFQEIVQWNSIFDWKGRVVSVVTTLPSSHEDAQWLFAITLILNWSRVTAKPRRKIVPKPSESPVRPVVAPR